MGFINQFPYSDWHELNLDWLIKITKAMAAQVDYLSEEFAKIEILTEEYIQQMIDVAIRTNNIELYNKMNELHTQITNEYQAYVQAQLSLMETYVNNQDVYYDNLAKNYADTALIQANNYTDEHVLDYTMMINPITGEYDDVRVVVNDIVSYFHTENALTAAEYDALDLTASAYEAYDLTAYDYDFNGKLRLV